MEKCMNYSENETKYLCMKHHVFMCEEDLKCQDPELYCKFRPSCMIWFIDKERRREEAQKKEREELKKFSVTFMPDGKKTDVAEGATLLDAAREADISLPASCNGKGACGKCKLIFESGNIRTTPTPLLSEEEKAKNYVLACLSTVHGHVSVRIPEEIREKKLKVAGMGQEATDRLKGIVTDNDPILKEIFLELNPPSLEDHVSDLDRLNRGLKQSGCDIDRLNVGLRVIRQLADVIRKENWKVTVSVIRKKCSNEILEIVPGHQKTKSLGLAIDVGTTSIVVYLVDINDGTILAAASDHNRQASCGDDVINRIVCAEQQGVKKLSRMVLSTINSLIKETLGSQNRDYREIKNVVISGNTTMTHLLLAMEPRHIRREPYIPVVSEFPVLKGAEVGLKVNPIAAVFIMPGPASYVGGDIVSGVLYSGFHKKDTLTLFIDVGTNGEIVLGNKEWLMTASCSAGPAFEGGGVRWGMRAEQGAIEKIKIDPETFVPEYKVVGNEAPRGICGSGMIDLISEMLLTGIIDQQGKISLDKNHERIKDENGDLAYILEFAEKTVMGDDIIFTESDIDNIMRSKAAIYAGFTVLLNQAGLDFTGIEQVIITGGFGQYLDIEKAITIGLLPDMDREKFKYLGNSSIAGAYMALLSDDIRREARIVSNGMTYIDFSSNPQFMNEFTSALFLPHTNMEDFPSIKKKL